MSDLLLLLSSLHMNFCSLSELIVYDLLLSLRAHCMICCSSMIYTFDNENCGNELLTASGFHSTPTRMEPVPQVNSAEFIVEDSELQVVSAEGDN